jgi:RHS repeat-associated protein
MAHRYQSDDLLSRHDVYASSGSDTYALEHINYSAFGAITLETTASVGGRLKYTAEPWDANTGLQYNDARYYNPSTGQWISQDPTGFAGGSSNLYEYVGNDTTNKADPSGLQGEKGEVTSIKLIKSVNKWPFKNWVGMPYPLDFGAPPNTDLKLPGPSSPGPTAAKGLVGYTHYIVFGGKNPTDFKIKRYLWTDWIRNGQVEQQQPRGLGEEDFKAVPLALGASHVYFSSSSFVSPDTPVIGFIVPLVFVCLPSRYVGSED